MLSPVLVTEPNLGTFSHDFAPLSAMIDQSGLDFPFTNGVTDFDNYFALPNNHYSKNADHTKWQSDFSFNFGTHTMTNASLATAGFFRRHN